MTIYEQWTGTAYTQDGKWVKVVWDKYLPLEQKIYEYFLSEKVNFLKGHVKELAEKYSMTDVFFTGFLDGISGALDNELNVSGIDENTEIDISFKWDVLYKKMVEYKAEHLYSLPEWNNIFTAEERSKLFKEQKTSRTVVREGPKTGRNDPCPCGSGKKYKKCCQEA